MVFATGVNQAIRQSDLGYSRDRHTARSGSFPRCHTARVDDNEVVTSQSARSWWQHVEDVIFMVFPKEIH
jgi:hypothetical protein